VRFIEKNTAGVKIGTSGNEFVDPYTGASRYQSSANSAPPSTSAASFMDPYTGASRYSGASQQQSVPASSHMDPYTGASRYSGAPQTSATAKILPVPKFVTFKQANVSAMQSKLYQFDEALRNEISAYSLAMYPDEQRAVDQAFSYLTQVVAGKDPTKKVTSTHVEAIIQILNRWPLSQRFPVIDLSRLVTGYCPDAFASPELKERFFEALFRASDWTASWSLPLSKPKETNILLLFRALANVFQEGTTINDGVWVQQVFNALSQAPYLSLTKAQRVALATILFNFSCLILTAAVDPVVRGKHLTLIIQVLQSETNDSEAVYRGLVALGNVVYVAKVQEKPLDEAQTGKVAESIRTLPGIFGDERVQSIVAEITQLL